MCPDLFFFNLFRDNVEWDASQKELAKHKVMENSSVLASQDDQEKYEVRANKYWDSFYSIHQNRFFKDRHWLFTEFPELAPDSICVNIQKEQEPVQCENSLNSIAVGSDVAKEVENNKVHVCENTKDEVKKLSEHFENILTTDNEKKGATTILEIGCGVGNTVFPILQYNANPDLFVFCCDFSSTAIQILQDNSEYDRKR